MSVTKCYHLGMVLSTLIRWSKRNEWTVPLESQSRKREEEGTCRMCQEVSEIFAKC